MTDAAVIKEIHEDYKRRLKAGEIPAEERSFLLTAGSNPDDWIFQLMLDWKGDPPPHIMKNVAQAVVSGVPPSENELKWLRPSREEKI